MQKRFRSPYVYVGTQVVIVPHNCIGLATTLQMRQEEHIRLTFIWSICTIYLEANVIAKTLCICPEGRRRLTVE